MPEPAQRPPRTEPRVCRSVMRWNKKNFYRWHADPWGWNESCDPKRARFYASLNQLIPELSNQSQWGLKQGQSQGHWCCSEQIITARENTMRDLGMCRQTGRQYTVSYPHKYTHLIVCFSSAAYDGLRWNTLRKEYTCLKEAISAELLASGPICKRIISSINLVFRDLNLTTRLQCGQLSVFSPDTTFV